MRYIKDEFFACEKPKYFGIGYYTCRKPDLDPHCEEYLNVALFAKQRKGEKDGEKIVGEKDNNAPIDINEKYPFHITSRFDMELWKKLEFLP